MGFWEKSRRLFKCLCEHGTQSGRRLAQQTGCSKRRVHRLPQAMVHRDIHPESWLWETEAGRQWFTRLGVATLYTFGLKRGVGMDTMQEFVARLPLATQVGCAPSALRRVMQTLEATRLETAATWEQESVATGEDREIIGAVDETFLERMGLVLLDLPTGYVVLEAAADDRSYATWHALVEKRLEALRAQGRSVVSDRAKALIHLAEQGLECLRMPDVFHLVHDIVKSYSLTRGRRLQQARQEWHRATDGLQKQREVDMQAKQAEVTRWEASQREYRQRLATLSLTLHPFGIDAAAPQTSTQGEARLHRQVEAMEALAHTHQFPERQAAMTKGKKPLPAFAALVDFWWPGVRQDLEHAALSPLGQPWAQEALLPRRYWEHQMTRTRCARRKAQLQRALESVRVKLDTHAITRCLPPQVLEEWQAWATHQVYAFHRASSAVEGRNGCLAQLHHNQRGLPTHRYKVWTVLQPRFKGLWQRMKNFSVKAAVSKA